MTDKDKRFIVKSVGLDPKEMYGEHICRCGFAYVQIIDPTTASGMYDHVWKAFEENEGECRKFLNWLDPQEAAGGYFAFQQCTIDVGYLKAPDLAQALLEFFREKELT